MTVSHLLRTEDITMVTTLAPQHATVTAASKGGKAKDKPKHQEEGSMVSLLASAAAGATEGIKLDVDL